MYIGKPIGVNEKDLLVGNEFDDLLFHNSSSISESIIKAPAQGWTHESIESSYRQYSELNVDDVFDVFLGSQWIGGSEV